MSRNIPALDGFRAISICLVIAGHIFDANFAGKAYTEKTYTQAILGNGSLGVTIFFVISGYLITTLLLREFDRLGNISLRHFYIRRAFRILPPYYVYLLVVCAVAMLGYLPITRLQAGSAFLFLWDYLPQVKTWSLEHLWSLSVEEQFYVLWPLSLLLCLRKSRRAARRLALICIVLAPIGRVGTYFTHSYYSSQLYFMLHTRIDSLMFGCLAALAEGHPSFESIYRRMARYRYLMIVFIFGLSPVLGHRFGARYVYVLGYSLEGLFIAASMLWLIRNPDTLFGRLLNQSSVKQIGVMSYSLYIWQTIFLHSENHSVLGHFPINVVSVFVCAALSYRCVELPSLALRERLFSLRKVSMPPQMAAVSADCASL